MTTKSPYYKPSGNFNITSLLIPLGIGIGVAAVLSIIYTYAIHYIPFVYLNFLITLGFGIALGFCVNLGVKIGKIRNKQAVIFISLVVGLIAVYLQWVYYFFVILKHNKIFFNPGTVYNLTAILAKTGSWSIKRYTPKGIVLYGVWFIELAMIAGGAIYFALTSFKSMIFCEDCQVWIDESEKVEYLEPLKNSDIKSDLEKGEFKELKNLKRVPVEEIEYTEIELKRCSKCQNLNVMTLKEVKIKINKDDKEEKKENEIVENLLIDGSNYSALLKLQDAEMINTEKEPIVEEKKEETN